jgi:hypothetical protein
MRTADSMRRWTQRKGGRRAAVRYFGVRAASLDAGVRRRDESRHDRLDDAPICRVYFISGSRTTQLWCCTMTVHADIFRADCVRINP